MSIIEIERLENEQSYEEEDLEAVNIIRELVSIPEYSLCIFNTYIRNSCR